MRSQGTWSAICKFPQRNNQYELSQFQNQVNNSNCVIYDFI